MRNIHLPSLKTMRNSMILLNFIVVILYASLILLTTKYIVENAMARDFFDKISFMPSHPVKTFFMSILFFIILLFILFYKNEQRTQNQKVNIFFTCLELFVCFIIIYYLNMGYNGIILLVFADTIFHLKDNKNYKWILSILVILYLITNYDLFSLLTPLTSIDEYIQVYNNHIKGLLFIGLHTLETLNIILFIVFMIIYITEQMKENEDIANELSMIYQVNHELKNYAAITEKIGEDNERKRLAREIHDTLGHALTGIAAGVDACIAMIDINPAQTKQQLQLVSKVVRQGIGDVRNSLNKLRPGALEKHGLKGAIEKMIDEFSSVSDLQFDFQYDIDKLDFENTKEDILFRIVQESTTNALRHGGATLISIHLYQEDSLLYLKIQDNGKGCDDIHFGFGLKQMKERVAIINGEVEYDGKNGFLTVVKIPIQRGEKYD